MAAEVGLQGAHFGGQLFEERHGRGVHEGVHGVEAQAVQVVVAQPHLGIVAEEAAHLPAARAVEIRGGAPGCLVAAVKYGPKRSR